MRSRATPGDMVFGSEYQVGRPWMARPEDTWPCKKSFSPAPAEEFRKDMQEGACCIVKGEEPQEHDFPEVKKGGGAEPINQSAWVCHGCLIQVEKEGSGIRACAYQHHPPLERAGDRVPVGSVPEVG
jgi:hypothetical protein